MEKRKLIAISETAFKYLLLLRDAEAKRLNYRLVTITDFATNLILAQPVPDGAGPVAGVELGQGEEWK
jgi:hypothetical protein